MIDSNVMKNIERFGERYCKKYLFRWNKERLENNWWEALKFFFSHSFPRGRPDRLSMEYYSFTIKALEDYFAITNENLEESYKRLKEQKEHFNKEHILKFKKNIGGRSSVKHPDFEKEIAEKNPVVKLLVTSKVVKVEWDDENYNKTIRLKNVEDIMMVLDVLKFISNDEKKNVYNYLRNMITHDIKVAYGELIKMRAIKDKIATLIIRDIGLLNPEIKIAYEDYKLAFPVDTWVKRIARKLGCESEKIEEIKSFLIEKCNEFHIEPLKFAAGLWFLGSHSLDILLEDYLGKVKI